MPHDLPHLEPLLVLGQRRGPVDVQRVRPEPQLQVRRLRFPGENIFPNYRKYFLGYNSLDAVRGGDDDGRVAGEERGAAAVPALVVAQHGHVPRQLPGPRLAPCTRVTAVGHV